MMPKLSGIELAQRLRAKRPDIKLILMSGYAQEGSMEGIDFLDEIEIVDKPFSPSRLAEVVQEMLDGT